VIFLSKLILTELNARLSRWLTGETVMRHQRRSNTHD